MLVRVELSYDIGERWSSKTEGDECPEVYEEKDTMLSDIVRGVGEKEGVES
jgi:hypothetical protein